jgi:hypothetical protein
MMIVTEFLSLSLSRVTWKAKADCSMHRKIALTLMIMREMKSHSPRLMD